MKGRPKHIVVDQSVHEKDGAALCSFCNNGGGCIFEEMLGKEQWCACFEPRKARYYNVIHQNRYGTYDYRRMLKIMTGLFSRIPDAIRICMDHEKPNIFQWARCPFCRAALGFHENATTGFRCGGCGEWFHKKKAIKTYEKIRLPLSEHLLMLKGRIPDFIRFLLRREEINDKRRAHKGEQECQK